MQSNRFACNLIDFTCNIISNICRGSIRDIPIQHHDNVCGPSLFPNLTTLSITVMITVSALVESGIGYFVELITVVTFTSTLKSDCVSGE